MHQDGSFALRSDKQVVVDAAEDISITSDQKLTLTAAGDATLTTEPGGDGAPGNVSVTAKGKAAMKGATGVTVDSDADVAIEAKASLTLKSGASADDRERRPGEHQGRHAEPEGQRTGADLRRPGDAGMTTVLGTGLAFPLGVDDRGRIALAREEIDVEQAIRIILSTAPGERPMRPEFGCAVHDCVFERIEADTLARIDQAVRVALDRWEPRIDDRGHRLRVPQGGRAARPSALPPACDERRAQPRLPVLRRARRGGVVTLELQPLDDLRFQDLVTQARKRIALRCPEWDEHNVSDPGITLIEQFASMIEMLGYRIDRIPERLHIALLRLLDIELAPPVAATVDLDFRLAGPAEREVTIPAHETEVTTTPAPGERTIAFQVAETFVIRPLRPVAVALRRGGRVDSLAVSQGVCRPTGPDRVGFGAASGSGRRVVPRVRRAARPPHAPHQRRRFEGVGRRHRPEPAAAALGGVRQAERTQPSQEGWAPARVLKDTTKGFNAGGGEIDLQMPESTAAAQLAAERWHWVRCRLAEDGLPDRRYRRPPLIDSITAHVVGALVPAQHAARVANEELGVSDGTPAQTFHVRLVPALEPSSADELLEVREQGSLEWVPWTAVDSFADSGADDRHFRFDPASGRVELGPAILAPRKGWVQHGAVPPKGATLRMAAYHHGGGARGNVAPGALRVLRKGIPGVASVRNEAAARGGVDAETIDVGRQRAELELRTRDRAVTAQDFEFLAGEATPRVARARCGRPEDGQRDPGVRAARGAGPLPRAPAGARLRRPDAGEGGARAGPRVPGRAARAGHVGRRPARTAARRPGRRRRPRRAVRRPAARRARDPARAVPLRQPVRRVARGRPGGVGASAAPSPTASCARSCTRFRASSASRCSGSTSAIRRPARCGRTRPARRSSSAGTSSSAPETTPSAAAVTESAPPTASARRYLRDGVPVVYRENDFAMRFLHGLEEVLDPIVAFLDALPAHIDVTLAPPEFVTLVGEWLGVDPEGRWEGLLGRDEFRRRALVGRATVIARRRGTGASLQLVLDLLFPDLGLRVRDFGRSTFSAEPRDPPAADASFEVISTVEPARRRRAADRPGRRAAAAGARHLQGPARRGGPRMSRVCPSCGYDQLSEQIDWCPRCNEFLAWDGNGGDTVDSSGEGATVATPAIAPAGSRPRAPPAAWSSGSGARARRPRAICRSS